MNKQCKFKVGKYNCGSYAFNLWKEDIKQGDYCDRHYWQDQAQKARADEREACEALHQHEDVLAPVGNSAWGEAYQEGWAQGTAAYRDAIRARGEQA
jgi:hypothetical protein